MTDLVLSGLTKSYGTVAALDRVELHAGAGQRTVVVGPSGSGKSTLLRLVAGFERPDAGQILLDGASVADGRRIVPAHLRGVGIVPQDGALFPHLDVAANIAFGLPRRATHRIATVRKLMEMVELDPAMAARRPDQLSGGQQQRVALARALAPGPRLLLLDEAFSSLDTGLRASTRRAVMGLLQRTGVTTILVTHDQEEALSFADHLVVLRRGRVEQAGAPKELYQRPANEFVARFFGEVVILSAHLHDGAADCALGTVATSNGTAGGPGTIMVRSEQIVVVDSQPNAARARVDAVEFCGSTVALTLSLGEGGALAQLRLQIPVEHGPMARSGEVSLAVRGPVVVLPR